jgi:hypothetical protein
MLRFGINLKLTCEEEEKYYCQRLRYWIQEQDYFDAESENDLSIDIYVMNELSLKVKIVNSTLKFEPLEESSYECIMLVLQFISEMHDKVQEDFKKDDQISEELLRKSFHALNKDDDDEDSDDMEWV